MRKQTLILISAIIVAGCSNTTTPPSSPSKSSSGYFVSPVVLMDFSGREGPDTLVLVNGLPDSEWYLPDSEWYSNGVYNDEHQAFEGIVTTLEPSEQVYKPSYTPFAFATEGKFAGDPATFSWSPSKDTIEVGVFDRQDPIEYFFVKTL